MNTIQSRVNKSENRLWWFFKEWLKSVVIALALIQVFHIYVHEFRAEEYRARICKQETDIAL